MGLKCPICNVVYCSTKRKYYDRHLSQHKKKADKLVQEPASKKPIAATKKPVAATKNL